MTMMRCSTGDRGEIGFVGIPQGLTEIPEEDDSPKAEEMIRRLVAGQETVVRTVRAIFPRVEEASDQPTADLLTQRMQVHEKNAWMLRSLLG
jgi:starvation-inducible DNA-binding protein